MEAQSQAMQERSGLGRPPLMSLSCLAVSIALLLPYEAIDRALGGAPRLALCSLLWVGTLSLPQAAGGKARWSIGLGLGLAVLGLAVQLDLSRGFTIAEVWTTAWPTLLFLVLLPGAASRAREAGRATRHAILWFVLLPGAPLLAHTLEIWGGLDLPGWLEFIASASPLDWLAERSSGGGEEPWLPLGVAVLLFSSSAASTLATEEVPE